MELEFFNWQTYLALGLAFIILEAFVTSFFLFPIGIALIVVAVISPYAGLEVELLSFAAICVISFFVSFKVLKPMFRSKRQLTGADSLVGRIVSVHEEVNEDAGTGQVKVYADEWRALPSQMGQVIFKNEKVIIDRIDGNKVYVTKVQ